MTDTRKTRRLFLYPASVSRAEVGAASTGSSWRKPKEDFYPLPRRAGEATRGQYNRFPELSGPLIPFLPPFFSQRGMPRLTRTRKFSTGMPPVRAIYERLPNYPQFPTLTEVPRNDWFLCATAVFRFTPMAGGCKKWMPRSFPVAARHERRKFNCVLTTWIFTSVVNS